MIWDEPDINLRTAWYIRYSKDMAEIPDYALYMTNVYLRYAWDILKLYPRYTWDIHMRWTWDIWENTRDIPEIYPISKRYQGDIQEIHPRCKCYIPETYFLYA